MSKEKGSLKINFCNEINADYIEHHNQLSSNLTKAKGGSFSLSFNEINPIVQDGDMVDFPFRHLSATIVGAGSWKATDFSNENVLIEAASLLTNKPVYLNHDMRVGNEVGVTGEIKFTNKYLNKNGVVIPSGLDGPISIDSVLYPQHVRKMSGKNPSIRAASVTVAFDWEGSHEFERPNDFYWHLGEMIDGTMVRRIVTKITAFFETSLVWLGADPFAGILDEDGEVKYINNDGVVALSAPNRIKEMYDQENKFALSFCFGQGKKLNLDLENKNNFAMKNLFDKIASKFGVTSDELTEEMIQSFVFTKEEDYNALKLKSENSVPKTELEAVQLSLTGEKDIVLAMTIEQGILKESIAMLTTEGDSLKAKALIADGVVANRRSYAIELYSKSVEGKVNKSIQEELEGETSFERLEAKIEMFGGKALSHFGGKCNTCGSTEIGFRSSIEDDSDTQKTSKEIGLSYAEQVRLEM